MFFLIKKVKIFRIKLLEFIIIIIFRINYFTIIDLIYLSYFVKKLK